ncbi:MAG TPA: hypothetical protein PK956_10650 [Burkholderiaceae bacterium]|jgi:hypothetical protein|nr:hypothetical protein [Burkholderiaceae bacterium]HRA79256.1 hypothetical protein [Burkholderiaceae bacterium]
MGRQLSALIRRLAGAGAAWHRRRATRLPIDADEWLLRDIGAPQAMIDAARAHLAASPTRAALRRLDGLR